MLNLRAKYAYLDNHPMRLFKNSNSRACFSICVALSESALSCQEYAYNTVEVAAEVIAPSGSSYIIHALAFKTDPCAVAPAQTLPSQRYMTIIRQGARQSGLDAAYCCWIDRIPTAILHN